ncbi:MAG: glucose-methanol-choline oxidoreductase [Hyphomicrobiales bacterium]|nr:glucose-methanol-choline oxidoreductase [Hyphomicrobiales bacterium]
MLADRLSADGAARMLVLEAGGRDRDPLIHISLGLAKMHHHRLHDWGYQTEPDAALNGRTIEAMRGKVHAARIRSTPKLIMAFRRYQALGFQIKLS